MGQIGQWHSHVFEVSHHLVRSFTGLQIKGGIETDTKETKGQKYTYRKSGSPAEISMTIHLFASLGCDVQEEAMALVYEAQAGTFDYFYLGQDKLVPYQLMLTSATVQEVNIAPGGQWVRADVAVKFSQSDGTGGTAGSGGKAGSGSSKDKLRMIDKEAKEVLAILRQYVKDAPTVTVEAEVRQTVRDTDVAVNQNAKAASLVMKNPGAVSSSPGTRFAPTTKKIVPDTR